LEQGGASSGNAVNRVEVLAEEESNPLLLLLLVPLFIVYTIITSQQFILFLPVVIVLYLIGECGIFRNFHPTGGDTYCDILDGIFDKQDDNNKEFDLSEHADGSLFSKKKFV
jgi:hypothetical protein